MDNQQLFILIVPLVALQLGLQAFALVNLLRRPTVRGSKLVWLAVIVLLGLVGPIVYLVASREDA